MEKPESTGQKSCDLATSYGRHESTFFSFGSRGESREDSLGLSPLVSLFPVTVSCHTRLSAALRDAWVCPQSLLSVTGKDRRKDTVKRHHQESVWPTLIERSGAISQRARLILVS